MALKNYKSFPILEEYLKSKAKVIETNVSEEIETPIDILTILLSYEYCK
ncbi:MAG: hypothetical protein PHW34_11445 [Hespellia sp.]|nr:hypothetical protein [Hespellia sp.]